MVTMMGRKLSLVHMTGRQGGVHCIREPADPKSQQILKPGSDHHKCQVKYDAHDRDKEGDRRIFPGENAVDLCTSQMLFAFSGLYDAFGADFTDKGKTHIRNRGAAVQAALILKLQNDMLQQLFFISVQLQLIQDQGVAFNELAGCKTDGNPDPLRMVLDQVAYRVQAAVNRSAVVTGVTEVLPRRLFLVFRDMNGMADQLIHAFIFRGGYGDDGDAQHGFHPVNVDGTAVSGDLIHHVQGDDDGNIHFEQLHGQIEVALDAGRVHDIDDGFWLFIQDEIPGDQFFAGVGGHGIDARKVGYEGIGTPADFTVLAVHRNARKVSDVLPGAGQLVEERGFSAVLIAYQGKGQERAVRQSRPGPFAAALILLAQPGMMGFFRPLLSFFRYCGRIDESDINFLRFRKAQRELVAMKPHFHRVAHGSQLDQRDLHARDYAHIKEMLTERAFAADFFYHGTLAGFQIKCIVVPAVIK